MGQSFSEPVSNNPYLGYVAVALRSPNKVRLIHAPQDVVLKIEKIILEINKIFGESDAPVEREEKYGCVEYCISSGYCFQLSNNKSSATSGKLFVILMFEEMYKLGYDAVVSSDLSRMYDQATLFFTKNTSERTTQRVACLAPGKSDTLVILRANSAFINIVRRAILESWPLGIQNEKEIHCCGEILTQIKLHGTPWVDYAGPENIQCRQMLINILGQLGAESFKLLAGVNIKGGTDSLFFIQDPSYQAMPSTLCMISLNKNDRLRLINCRDMVGPLRETISRNYGEIQREEEKYGSWEFKLADTPWWTSGFLAIQARQLISRISETMLSYGWALTTAIDISRSLNDKSVLLYTKSPNYNTSFSCIALSDVHRLRLVDFSSSHTEQLREVLERFYLPGVTQQGQRDSTCYEIDLNGSPWTVRSCANLHAR